MHWRMESKTHYINLDAKDIKAYIPQANETIHKHVNIKKFMHSKEIINLNKTGDRSRERKKTQTEMNKKRGFKRESTMAATICGVEALSNKPGR